MGKVFPLFTVQTKVKRQRFSSCHFVQTLRQSGGGNERKRFSFHCFFHANGNNIRLPPFLLLQIWQDSKSVDFVLAYNATDRQKIKRQIFERNLLSEGLLLDRDESQNIHFLKIHITLEVQSSMSIGVWSILTKSRPIGVVSIRGNPQVQVSHKNR